MTVDTSALKKRDLFILASQAKLMLLDGGVFYLNETAGERELIAFARLVETALSCSNESKTQHQ